MAEMKTVKVIIDNRVRVDADEFERLCRVDARMDALISYINTYDHAVKTGKISPRPLSKDAVKAIIGMCDE